MISRSLVFCVSTLVITETAKESTDECEVSDTKLKHHLAKMLALLVHLALIPTLIGCWRVRNDGATALVSEILHYI